MHFYIQIWEFNTTVVSITINTARKPFETFNIKKMDQKMSIELHYQFIYFSVREFTLVGF